MESISKISSLLESARDLTLEAARDASSAGGGGGLTRKTTRPLPTQQIKKLLDSRNEREVLDGLRRVIAMQYAHPPSPQQQQQPTLTFFPAVLKTLSNPYPSTRPLVYTYLLHHAEADPDTALLSINTIQKSLSDSNPRVRAMALKTMAGIRVPVISQIVSLAIKKGISDLSPLVRKAAALACVKCVRLDANTRPQVEEYISALLADKQYYVVGAAVQAFMEIFPAPLEERLGLIHPVYRRLCRMVVDMDEWGQLAVLRLLTVYARKCFPRRVKRVKRARTQEERAKDFYEDLEPAQDEEEKEEGEKAENETDYEEIPLTDPDLDLFLTNINPLLQSRNSAVITSVARAYLYLSPTLHLPHAIGPLIALLRSPPGIQQIALQNITQICLLHPTLFTPYVRHFLLHTTTESPQTQTLKLELLTLIFPHAGKEMQELILAELEHFSHSGHDPHLIRESVRALGRCAQSSSSSSASSSSSSSAHTSQQTSTSRRCLSLLLKHLHSPDQHLVGEAMQVIRHLIQRDPNSHRKTVIRLAKNLDTLVSPTARASVVWLVGEFAGDDGNEGGDGDGDGGEIAADVLRILLKGYADERDEVRGEIVLLAARCYLRVLNGRNAKRKALDALNPIDQTENHDDLIASPPEEEEEEEEEDNANQGFTPPPREPLSEPRHPVELLYEYTMHLAHYTPSYSLRDRARLYRALLAVPSSTELATLLLLAPKPVPLAPSPSEVRRGFVLGSASLVVGVEVGAGAGRKGMLVPEWVVEGMEPDPRLREELGGDGAGGVRGVEGGKVLVSAGQKLDDALGADVGYKGDRGGIGGGGGGKKEKTLDAWLDDEDDEESEETETEEGESEEEEDGESEYETESEEDERAGLVG